MKKCYPDLDWTAPRGPSMDFFFNFCWRFQAFFKTMYYNSILKYSWWTPREGLEILVHHQNIRKRMDHKKKYDNLTQHGNLDQSGPQKNERKKKQNKNWKRMLKGWCNLSPRKKSRRTPGSNERIAPCLSLTGFEVSWAGVRMLFELFSGSLFEYRTHLHCWWRTKTKKNKVELPWKAKPEENVLQTGKFLSTWRARKRF